MNNIYGLVLSGGEGRRLGYKNKGLIDIFGQPLIAYVCARLKNQVDKIIISANQCIELYEKLGYEIVCDAERYKGLGPLAGIESVLSHLPKEGRLQIVTCDVPFIPDNLVATLSPKAGSVLRAFYPKTMIRSHYSLLQADIQDLKGVSCLLEARQLRMRDLLQTLNAEPIYFEREDDFLNSNTKEELNIVKKYLKGGRYVGF